MTNTMKRLFLILIPVAIAFSSCGSGSSNSNQAASDTIDSMIKFMTVDPGHFHAALVQKKMYGQISPDVYVYAPEGPDVLQHIGRINSYNTRPADPTKWNEIIYTGDDFFEKMLEGKPGNVVVLSGNNRKKAEYISKSVSAGLNVLADKPMIISPDDFANLVESFRIASEKGILLYDIMTERYEVSTILQKELSRKEEIFGHLLKGSEKDPAVTKVSVHHFSKVVSGSSLIRPAWFFDVDQQGEGIVDVTTHLVDLVQWECFPEQILDTSDIEMISARRWPTVLSMDEFKGVTGLKEYPAYLNKNADGGMLSVYSNGEMNYKIRDVFAKVSVEWKYQAPPGGGDTHYSVMRGTICDLIIRQGAEEKFLPTLYIENVKGFTLKDFNLKLKAALATLPYDSLAVEEVTKNSLKITVPEKYRVTHEDHFGQVTAKFLEYLEDGKLPEWEVPNMITKYYTTTSALKLSRQKK
jgi:predicted dehydrogenase